MNPNVLSIQYHDTPQIAHECESYLVAFKPRCMHTEGEEEGTLMAWLIAQKPELVAVSDDAGLIQRLDYFTCGLIIAAKNAAAHQELKELLLAKKIKKSYLALVEGKFEEPQTFTSFIGSPYRRAKKVRVYEDEPSKKDRALEGTTQFSPILLSEINNFPYTLIEASAPVARRHQIRAHASHLRHPLIGDELYGSKERLGIFNGAPSEGFFLFAHKLEIPKLTSEPVQTITVEPPNWLPGAQASRLL